MAGHSNVTGTGAELTHGRVEKHVSGRRRCLSPPGQQDLCPTQPLQRENRLCNVLRAASRTPHLPPPPTVLWTVPRLLLDDSLPKLFCLTRLQVTRCVKPVEVCLPSCLLFCKARAARGASAPALLKKTAPILLKG